MEGSSLVDDDITLLDITGNEARNRHEPVAGVDRRLHAPGRDVPEQDRLTEQLADYQQEDGQHEDETEPSLCESDGGHESVGDTVMVG
ncbi:hypothetical protein JCM9743_26670 [Natrinema sp. JCM 9743]